VFLIPKPSSVLSYHILISNLVYCSHLPINIAFNSRLEVKVALTKCWVFIWVAIFFFIKVVPQPRFIYILISYCYLFPVT
jgi:hypothetical protein